MPDTLSRTLPATRRVLGDVDPAQPLDTTHPLSREVEGFWLPTESRAGGDHLYDLSPKQRKARFAGDPTWVSPSGSMQPAIDLDGSDDGIEYGYKGNNPFDYLWNGSTPFTVAVDFYSDGTGRLFTAQDATWWIALTGSVNGDLGVRTNQDGSWGSPVSTWDITYPARNFVVVTYDPNGGYGLYVNGDKKDSNTLTGSINDRYINLGLGHYSYQGGSKFMDGWISFASVHRRSLSEEEVTVLDNERRQGFPDLLNRRDSVGLLGGGGGPAADTVSPGTGTALADGFDPVLTAAPNTISAGTGQAAAQGFSATVTATQNTVSLGTAQATAQGFAPTITTGSNTIAATTGQAAAQGFDPTISEGAAGDTLVADLGTAQAQAFDPTITTTPATVTLGLGQASATGFDPDVVTDPSEINTGQGQALATGFDPTITTNARAVAPQVGQAQAQGFDPAVVDGTVGVATTMEIEARPLYEIDVEAKPLYRIRLFVKEQLP